MKNRKGLQRYVLREIKELVSSGSKYGAHQKLSTNTLKTPRVDIRPNKNFHVHLNFFHVSLKLVKPLGDFLNSPK